MDKFQTGVLRAYEVLKGLGGGTANRLKALLAFMQPEFAQRDGKELDTTELIAAINANMKLALTEDAFQDIIPHIEKMGWLERLPPAPGGARFVIRCHRPPVPDPRSVGILDKLAAQFGEFLDSRNVPQRHFPRDRSYLGECLVEWLISIDTSDTLSIVTATQEFHNSDDQIEYFCARFVSELINRKSAIVEDLQLISQVGLLSDLVREFKKPLSEVKSTDLRIILDSPIMLELLGAHGEAARQASGSLVQRLSKRGAKFLYLDASITEIRQSIQVMMDLPIFERYGPTHTAMQKGEIDDGYIWSIYHNCRDLLRELSVQPLSTELKRRSSDVHYVPPARVDKLTQDLESIYRTQTRSHYRARHDAQAVAAIMRLRAGEFASNDVFKAKYVFLTRNQAFRNTARAFCLRDTPREPALMSDEEIGPVVDMKEMASAIFARMPSDDEDEFSRMALMAACERVLRLNRRVVARISTLVNKMALHATDNAEAMRKVRVAMLHPGSSLYLQDRLRGENRELTYDEVLAEQKRFEQDNIDKGIEKNRDHYRKQIEVIEHNLEQSLQQIKELQHQHETEIQQKEDELKAIEEKRADDAQRLTAAAEQQRRHAERLKAQERRRAERIIANVDRANRRMRRNIRLAMVLLIGAVVVVKMLVEKSWPGTLDASVLGLNVNYWLAIGLTVILVVIESAGGVVGDIKVPLVRDWLAARLRDHLEQDREYDEFTENEVGLSIEQEGFDFRLVEGHTEDAELTFVGEPRPAPEVSARER
ncbi:MAG TPA: hypothetical protein VFZ91_15305 [Allosphingosinicella sp.]